MNRSLITVRYAKALFSLASENNILDEVYKNIIEISQLVENSPDFILLLESPIVKTSKKLEVLSLMFKGNVNEYVLSFLLLITENKREVHIPSICTEFKEQYRHSQGIKSAILTTSHKISKELESHIKTFLSEHFKTKIELTIQVKEEIIGGLILRVDDQQIDESVLGKLRRIKEDLEKTQIV
ncbi:ATP synthase F1 subunit delta [Puteibacter caeruleilacunae]|nr:ATP synthase F1 subunit delta [Puteibacter caeruleilacunae]